MNIYLIITIIFFKTIVHSMRIGCKRFILQQPIISRQDIKNQKIH
jgi:hypothetical protein